MLINLSNHPLSNWEDEPKIIGERNYGCIKDMRFPVISPEAELKDIEALAEKYVADCLVWFDERRIRDPENEEMDAVHVMGEMTFVYQFVKKMSLEGVSCVASTTKRNTEDLPEGKKLFKFKFVRFRPYTTEWF